MTKSGQHELIAGLVALLCVAVVGVTQPEYTAKLKSTRYRTDVLELPPASHVQKMAVGYKSALVDLLWAKILVEQGLHFSDRRRFDALPSYIDAIIALEPTYKPIYEFVDTLILYQYIPGNEEDARLTRKYLEAGTKARPYDHELWLHYGQYLAFVAPSFLTDPAEIERSRVDGALAISKAVDLGADADRSLAATSILDKAGRRKAAIRGLQRQYALTDDEETRKQIRFKLMRMQADVEAEGTVEAVEWLWRSRYPFLSRGEVLMIGPLRDPVKCAGMDSLAKPRECPADWSPFEPNAGL